MGFLQVTNEANLAPNVPICWLTCKQIDWLLVLRCWLLLSKIILLVTCRCCCWHALLRSLQGFFLFLYGLQLIKNVSNMFATLQQIQ